MEALINVVAILVQWGIIIYCFIRVVSFERRLDTVQLRLAEARRQIGVLRKGQSDLP